MFFSETDRNNLLKMVVSSENNKERLIHMASEFHCISTILKRLEITLDNMNNEMETIKTKLKDVEGKFAFPKTDKPQHLPKKKK
jgi:hypothetical protein